MLDQVASMLDGEQLEVPSVQKKRWRLDQRQQRARIALRRGAQQCLGGPWAGAGTQQLRPPTAKALVTGSAGHEHRGHGVGAPQLIDLG